MPSPSLQGKSLKKVQEVAGYVDIIGLQVQNRFARKGDMRVI